MEFLSYYQAISDLTEKRKLRNKVIDACMIQPPTFYGWMARKKVPPLAEKIINKIMAEQEEKVIN